MYPPIFSIDALFVYFRFFFFGFLGSLYTIYTGQKFPENLLPIASICALIYGLEVLIERLAWGKPRPMEWNNEIVVITGGSSGLGKVIVDIYRSQGCRVAILDVNEFEGDDNQGMENMRFYRCDVGDVEAIQAVKGKIEKELGTPTILINNAGIVNGKPLLSLGSKAVQRNFNVNLVSHFHTLQTFLPAMLQRPGGGTIVTVSSVLGNLGASHLSDYTAAKAGLMAMHTSLGQELAAMTSSESTNPGARNIKTILVKPGQLSTPLFAGVETPSNFFGPVVEPEWLADKIVKLIDSGNSGVIAEPLYARYIEWLGVLPYGLQAVARWASGVDKAMSGFGRR